MLRYSIALVAFVTGCALNPPPVPVRGDARSIVDLAGDWLGEYYSPDTRRSGSIMFKLEAEHDTAFGDVIMVPALSGWRTADTEDWLQHRPVRPEARPLTIRFVDVDENRVTGTIEPYRSPECGCLLYTTFVGDRRGNRIEGTFVTRHEDDCGMKPESGRWWVDRKRRSP